MFLEKVFHIKLLFWVGLLPITLVAQHNYASTQEFALSSPNVHVDSLLFIEKATIRVYEGVPNSTIFYQIEGEKKQYSKPLEFSDSKELTIWSEHPEFQKSAVQKIKVVKITDALSSAEITIAPNPNDSYSGNGPKTLIDLKKGTTSFRGNKRWLGFQTETIDVDLKIPKGTDISKVQIGVLNDQGSWIFMPSAIEITSHGKHIGKIENPTAIEESASISTFITVPVTSGTYNQISIKIKPLKSIPNWHPGKGTPAWVFIDEILIEP